jgi:hypothetical protein
MSGPTFLDALTTAVATHGVNRAFRLCLALHGT